MSPIGCSVGARYVGVKYNEKMPDEPAASAKRPTCARLYLLLALLPIAAGTIWLASRPPWIDGASITKDGAYYVNKERVSEYAIEKELKAALAGQSEPTIILRAEEGVPIEDAVFVMDIANKNNFKVVLAVRPN